MTTPEMFADSLEDGSRKYFTNENGGIFYWPNSFHYRNGNIIDEINIIPILRCENWERCEVMLRKDAEAKFNIKIMG